MKSVQSLRLLVGLSCCFASTGAQHGPTLKVFVFAGVAEDAIARGEVESSRMLQRAGVQVIWQNCFPEAPCKGVADLEDVSVRFLEETGRSGLGCSAVTLSGGVRAIIGLGNIERLAAATRIPKSQILGAVMTHEIAHLMLGPAHSGKGLMHGYWDMQDLSYLEQGRLKFDFDQCRRLQAAVLARSRPDSALVASRMP